MAPYLTPWDYRELNINNRMAKPSITHILGTDNLGRDTFARLLYGGRVTLRIAFVTASLAALSGSAIGLVMGYFRGLADLVIFPALNVLASIPIILMAVLFEAIFGWGRGHFIYAMIIAAIPQFAWLVRASSMEIVERKYIEASRALGVSHMGIIFRHVLPNVAPLLLVRYTGGLAEALLTCTIMGFFSIGINPPTPEWGALVFNASGYLRSKPHLLIIPCAVITICVISINLFGDGLRDALDPRFQDTVRSNTNWEIH